MLLSPLSTGTVTPPPLSIVSVQSRLLAHRSQYPESNSTCWQQQCPYVLPAGTGRGIFRPGHPEAHMLLHGGCCNLTMVPDTLISMVQALLEHLQTWGLPSHVNLVIEPMMRPHAAYFSGALLQLHLPADAEGGSTALVAVGELRFQHTQQLAVQ